MSRFFRSKAQSAATEDPISSDDQAGASSPYYDTEKGEKGVNDINVGRPASDSEKNDVEGLAHDGVHKAQAITQTWTKKDLIIVYTAMLIVFFVNSFQQQVANNLLVYVTSSFSLAPLVSITGLVSSVVGGVTKLPIAKMIDMWGRAEGFAVMVFITTIGIIMMAACPNVETYAAAQVFYWVGFDGMSYVLDVIIADTSSLKNRALMFSFTTTPYIATTFCGSPVAQSFYDEGNWRWGFGTFAIVTPVMCSPIIYILWRAQEKAKAAGNYPPRRLSGRTPMQSIYYWFMAFDVPGLILAVAGWVLLLLPFGLYSYQKDSWGSALCISMWVIGFLCQVAFVAWEKWFAPASFLPWQFMKDRTIVGACFLAMVLYIGFYCWDSYFSSFLQVVYGLSITDAGYVTNIYSIGSCFWGVVVGLLIRWSGRFKWCAIIGALVMLLASGLMIKFRQPGDVNFGFTIMCQILIAFAGGTLVICEQMAVMAAVRQEEIASVLALLALFYSIGGSIGDAISAGIWTGKFEQHLEQQLAPIGQSSLAAGIYADIDVALQYTRNQDNATYEAIADAIFDTYGYSQQFLCIASTVCMIFPVLFVMLWKDFKVKDLRQVEGTVL